MLDTQGNGLEIGRPAAIVRIGHALCDDRLDIFHHLLLHPMARLAQRIPNVSHLYNLGHQGLNIHTMRM
jgi:hypothetical protein